MFSTFLLFKSSSPCPNLQVIVSSVLITIAVTSIIIIIIVIIIYSLEFFTSALAVGLSLEFKW